MKKGIEYALVQLGDKGTPDKSDKNCIIFEHEDVATRHSETFMVCPYNEGKVNDFKTNINYVFEEKTAETATKDSHLFENFALSVKTSEV